jgi:lipoprotein-anchoring transpeptidase ErfK/SrfK
MKTLSSTITGLIFALLISSNAYSQSLSPYGMWNGPPEKRQKYEQDIYDFGVPVIEFDWDVEVYRIPQYNVNPGGRPEILPEEPTLIIFPNDEEPGTVVIDSKHKKLYYVLDNEQVYVYPIAVGRKGFQWSGVEKVSRIEYWPAWNPPSEMRQRQPGLPVRMEGGINNPLGAVAIYLGNTLYRIHGSNDPKSIGTEASSGCFRMHNAHAVHLASLIKIGATVKVY